MTVSADKLVEIVFSNAKKKMNDRDYRSFKIHYHNACLSALTVSIVREEGGISDAGPKYECTTYARTYESWSSYIQDHKLDCHDTKRTE